MSVQLLSRREDRDLRWWLGSRVSVRAYDEKRPSTESTFCVSTRSSELTYILCGEMEVHFGVPRRALAVRAGEAMVMLRGTPHRARSLPGTRFVILDIVDAPWPDSGAVLLREGAIPLALERLIPTLWDRHAAIEREAIESATRHLFGPRAFSGLIPLDAAHGAARLSRVKHYLEANYRDPISIADVAKRFGMGASYLARNYDRAFGISPLGYLQALRLEHFVWSLLEECEPGSLVTLANDAGFGDYSTFCRRVRNRFGCAPSALVTRR